MTTPTLSKYLRIESSDASAQSISITMPDLSTPEGHRIALEDVCDLQLVNIDQFWTARLDISPMEFKITAAVGKVHVMCHPCRKKRRDKNISYRADFDGAGSIDPPPFVRLLVEAGPRFESTLISDPETGRHPICADIRLTLSGHLPAKIWVIDLDLSPFELAGASDPSLFCQECNQGMKLFRD